MASVSSHASDIPSKVINRRLMPNKNMAVYYFYNDRLIYSYRCGHMVNKLNLNWPEFLEKYWQKKPVVLKNAFPDFVDPITPDELAGLAMEPEVDSRLVSFIDNKWEASHGPFEDYSELGEKGKLLTIGICRPLNWSNRFGYYLSGV